MGNMSLCHGTGKLYRNHERVGPCPVEAPAGEGFVPEGAGDVALLVRQSEVRKIRYRSQSNALAMEFVKVSIVSQERFEDAKVRSPVIVPVASYCTIHYWRENYHTKSLLLLLLGLLDH